MYWFRTVLFGDNYFFQQRRVPKTATEFESAELEIWIHTRKLSPLRGTDWQSTNVQRNDGAWWRCWYFAHTMSGDYLRHCAQQGESHQLRSILKNRGNPCSQDEFGLTALMYAVWNGHVECVKYLITNDFGVDKDGIKTTSLNLQSCKGGDLRFWQAFPNHHFHRSARVYSFAFGSSRLS